MRSIIGRLKGWRIIVRLRELGGKGIGRAILSLLYLIFGVVASLVIGSLVFNAVLQFASQYVSLFPSAMVGRVAERLLSAVVNIDGILLGFIAFVYTSMLGALESRINRIESENFEESLKLRTIPSEDGNIERLTNRRNDLLSLLTVASISLVFSIFWAFSKLSSPVMCLLRSDLQYLLGPIIVAVFVFVLSIWVYSK